jgi:hypothetical protein
MPWGNGIAALRWNHLFSDKLFMNVTTTFSDYMFKFGSQQDEFRFELGLSFSFGPFSLFRLL